MPFQPVIASAEQQQYALRAEITKLTARAEQAVRRTAEAEKDNGELLKARRRRGQGGAGVRALHVNSSGREVVVQEKSQKNWWNDADKSLRT